MTAQPTRPVLFVDGPLAGTWRDVPADQHGGVFYEHVDPFDARALPLGRAHYAFRTVRVSILGRAEHTVTIAVAETMEDLDALAIRRLFTPEAANALLGHPVTA